ncbi:MAG: hypothetical protein DRQ10_06200 [Candidatus Hydrothermota bacterium]|nr:MAG: hypothetical protein DRQ10_06200 [Candidatus Hydrothermae bacterium]
MIAYNWRHLRRLAFIPFQKLEVQSWAEQQSDKSPPDSTQTYHHFFLRWEVSQMQLAVEVTDLVKVYRKEKREAGLKGALKSLFSRKYEEIRALDGISFEVQQGEMVGLVGPNGAGKTTTMKILCGVLYPTSGTVRVLGFTPTDRHPEFLKNISLFMGQRGFLSITIWDLPPIDGYEFIRSIYEIDRAEFKRRLDFFVEMLGISELIDTPLRKLSLGERTKVELVAALIHYPKVVLLDEPTIGLDIVSQKRLRDFLKAFNHESGATVIITSHYMRDVEDLGKRLIVLHKGRILYDGAREEIVQKLSKTKSIKVKIVPNGSTFDFSKFGKVLYTGDSEVLLEVENEKVRNTAKTLLDLDFVIDISIEETPLEDILREVFTDETS